MLKNKIYFLFLVLGLCTGVFFALNKAKASSPQGETSGGEQPASVYYDEHWKATEALVSSTTGYTTMDPSTHNNTNTAGQFEDTAGGWRVELFPKMVVTKWKVHGHIHFE